MIPFRFIWILFPLLGMAFPAARSVHPNSIPDVVSLLREETTGMESGRTHKEGGQEGHSIPDLFDSSQPSGPGRGRHDSASRSERRRGGGRLPRVMSKRGSRRTAPTDRARVRAKFLEVLASTGNVSEAARAVGVERRTPYEWRKAEKDFAAAWDSAEETATDALEAEARRRAVEGWEEPVFRDAGQIGTIRKYSDRMLEILLKGHRHRYRENQKLEVTGSNGGPVQVTVADLARALAAKPSTPVDPS